MKTVALLLASLCAHADPQTGATELYYVVVLRPAADRKSLPPSEAERIQSAHMANIRKMAADRILVAAGPMDDQVPKISGVFIFKSASLEEARRIAIQDPTVVAHRNTVDVYQWLGPKGIGIAYTEWKQEHPDAPDHMSAHAFCVYRKSAPSNEQLSVSPAHWIDNRLAAGGPIKGDAELIALSIFKTASIEEARRAMEDDPAVHSGVLRVECHGWWSADHVLPR